MTDVFSELADEVVESALLIKGEMDELPLPNAIGVGVPEIEGSDDLVDKFVFTYRFLVSLGQEVTGVENIGNHFRSVLRKMEKKKGLIYSEEEQWQLLAAESIRLMASKETLDYLEISCDRLMYQIGRIDRTDVIEYLSSLNNSLLYELNQYLTPRPLLAPILRVDTYSQNVFGEKDLIESKDVIVKIASKYFTLEEFKSPSFQDEVQRCSQGKIKIDPWDVWYECFFSFVNVFGIQGEGDHKERSRESWRAVVGAVFETVLGEQIPDNKRGVVEEVVEVFSNLWVN